MSIVRVDFNEKMGKIKPVNGVGQPPLAGTDYSMFSYLKEANIPFSRLHDVGGPYGQNRYVDIPNLFRDFDADPCDPQSYDFTFTDMLITALVENRIEPFFRLGVTIENDAKIKAYRIYPPKNYLKWARICEGVIRHYTQGWANGFYYPIRYWEIWNEPDNYEEIEENQMWRGTKEQFYEFYDTAASYLKEKFPHLKIGGYGSCGFYAIDGSFNPEANSSPRYDYFITFFDGFIDYIKAHGSPLDFFSWHSYSEIEPNMLRAEYARRRLDEAGFRDTELTCNEWNCMPSARGTLRHAALTAGMMIAMQNSPLDSAMFYDAAISLNVYGGLFNPFTKKPFPAYYAVKGFGELYRLGMQVGVLCDLPEVYAAAATDGENGRLLIANTGGEKPLSLQTNGQKITLCRVIDEEKTFELSPLPQTLKENAVIYIETKKNL